MDQLSELGPLPRDREAAEPGCHDGDHAGLQRDFALDAVDARGLVDEAVEQEDPDGARDDERGDAGLPVRGDGPAERLGDVREGAG